MKNKALLTVFALFTLVSFGQQIGINLYANGFNNPVGIKHANDNRLFIVEKAGIIKIISSEQNVNTMPFLDINSLVSNSGGERGLLGLAFHPNYNSNGFFFVNYVNNSGNSVVSRFSRSSTNSDLANPDSEVVLLTITQPYSNHNGGDLAFGEDGYLYIATGDGGSGGDPENRAQDLTTLLGKLLRIDVDNSGPNPNYAIPADNPFIANATALNEIWAYGLRNPWRFSFDRTNNNLWIADVGQNNIEEINLVSTSEAGVNFGWRCYEGNAPYNNSGCPDASTLEFPIATYNHTGNGPFKCSITGGYSYQGADFSNFVNIYFFADYCSNEIGTLNFENGSWNMAFTQPFPDKGWTSFGENNVGELFITAADTGEIFQIIDNDLSITENSLNSLKIYPNPATDILTFEAGSTTNGLSEITIYNVHGVSVKKITNIEKHKLRISVSNLVSGLYFVEIRTINQNLTIKKLIID